MRRRYEELFFEMERKGTGAAERNKRRGRGTISRMRSVSSERVLFCACMSEYSASVGGGGVKRTMTHVPVRSLIVISGGAAIIYCSKDGQENDTGVPFTRGH